MTRKPYQETEELRHNQDRWLISYADFITLMLAFFVVLYAMNTLKYQQQPPAQQTLASAAAAPANPPACTPPETEQATKATTGETNALLAGSPLITLAQEQPVHSNSSALVPEPASNHAINLDPQTTQITSLASRLHNQLHSLIEQGKVQIQQSSWGISIDINASILFGSADATLNSEATATLNRITALLTTEAYPIRVEGYTDDKPIKTKVYPSNWELSSARASGVVRYFIQQGVNRQRLAAVGYAENNPIADNQQETGRARNRRVVLKILANEIDPLPSATGPDLSQFIQPPNPRSN